MIHKAVISSIASLYPLPQYVVILQDVEKTRLVPIWIGASEGNAIAIELQGEKFPRPLTHDLIIGMLETLGVLIEKVVINDLKDSSYYALIYLRRGKDNFAIDARPSDALAMAVRAKCPIYIDDMVLKKCPPAGGPITQKEVDKFKESLKSMTSEEFFKSLEDAPPAPEKQIISDFEEPPPGADDEENDEEDGGDEEEKI